MTTCFNDNDLKTNAITVAYGMWILYKTGMRILGETWKLAINWDVMEMRRFNDQPVRNIYHF